MLNVESERASWKTFDIDIEGTEMMPMEQKQTRIKRKLSIKDFSNSSGVWSDRMFKGHWKSIKGTMPKEKYRDSFPSCVLRGVSQVVFINNPITGLFCFIAILLESRYLALFGVIGVISSTITAIAAGFDRNAIRNGIFGYNGMLVGLALAYFHFGGDQQWNALPWLFLPVIAMTSISSFITQAVGNVLVPKLGLTPLTFPFQLATWIWIAGCNFAFTYMPINGEILQQRLSGPNNTTLPLISMIIYEALPVFSAVFRGIAQIFFVNNPISGALIAFGMLISSPIASFMAIFGSLFSMLFALAFGVSKSSIYDGLWGFNGCLACIAIGGFFLLLKGKRIWFFIILASLLSTLISGLIGCVFSPFGLPTLTFPFTLTVWILILSERNFKGAKQVPVSKLTVHEDHLRSEFLTHSVSIIPIVSKLFDLGSEIDVHSLEKEISPLLMIIASAYGQQELVEDMLELHVDVNALDQNGRSALHLAVASNQLNLTRALLDKYGANLHILDRFQKSPLDEAVILGLEQMCVILKSYGAQIHPNTEADPMRMCYLAFKNEADSLLRMLKYGHNPNLSDHSKRTALHVASCEGHFELVKALLKYDANFDLKDFQGSTAITDAKSHGRKQILDYLQSENRKDSKIPNEHHLSMMNFNMSMDNAKSLQRSSVIENRKSYIMSANQDKEKEEVLLKLMLPILCSYFVNKGNLKGLKTLFESHNCVEIMDYDMRTPLHIASANGNADIVTFLLSKGSNPNITDRWGKTPLWEALINNHIEIAKQLNLYGAILCRDNFVIGSEIFRFVLRNYLYHLNLFLRFGSANLVNIQDYDGRTPLHVAVYLENVPLIRMLIDLGADLNCRDRWKKSVLDYARESKSESVLRACTT